MSASSGARHSSDDDQALPFQLDALGVRGRLVRLSTTLDEGVDLLGKAAQSFEATAKAAE